MTLRKIPLWAQEDRILDVLVLEEDSAPKQIAVLDGEKVAIYRLKNGKWLQEQVLEITHRRPWPRDLRGRVIGSKDHLLDVYLPGVFCRSTTSLPLALNCRESDDPWPLTSDAAIPPLGGFYSASRNFFTGALTPGVGKLTTVAKFYSAAAVPRDKYVLWLFAGTNGQTHLVDGMTDQAAKLGLGSDVASVRATCGTGWQVLATSVGGPTLNKTQAPAGLRDHGSRTRSGKFALWIFLARSRRYGRRRKATAQSLLSGAGRQENMRRFAWQWVVVSSMLLMPAEAEMRPQYGGTLRVAMREAPMSLDPLSGGADECGPIRLRSETC